MHVKKLIAYNIRLCHSVVTKYLADLSDEELLMRPAVGANHIKWQLGHLIVSNDEMLRSLDADPPALPDEFVATHSRARALSGKPEDFSSKEEYLEYFEGQHEYAHTFIEHFSDSRLGEPGPEKTRAYLTTNAAVLLMLGTHAMMHVGQIAVLRRMLGKPVVI